MRHLLKVHNDSLIALVALIGATVDFNSEWLTDEGELREGMNLDGAVIAEGQLLSTTTPAGLPVIIGRFNDQLQVVYSVGREGAFHTIKFDGSQEFMDFIETDGYLKSIESLKIYFSLFEKGEELANLVDSFSIIDMGENEVQVVPTEVLFRLKPQRVEDMIYDRAKIGNRLDLQAAAAHDFLGRGTEPLSPAEYDNRRAQLAQASKKSDPFPEGSLTLEGQAAIDAVDQILGEGATPEASATEEAPAQSGKSDGDCLRDLAVEPAGRGWLFPALSIVGIAGVAGVCYLGLRKLAQ